jgi:hypothetical protein
LDLRARYTASLRTQREYNPYDPCINTVRLIGKT